MFVDRSSWNARQPRKHVHPYKWTDVAFVRVIRLEGFDSPQALQDHNMNHEGHPDICASFVVGPDGTVYEGRGWLLQVPCLHDRAAAIVVLGSEFTEDSLRAVRHLMYEADTRAQRLIPKVLPKELWEWQDLGFRLLSDPPEPEPEPDIEDLDEGPSFQRGDRGFLVGEAQSLLNHHIADEEPLRIDALFGPKTEQRIVTFQARKGMLTSGKLDGVTLAALRSPKMSAGKVPARSDDKTRRRLAQLGYRVGPDSPARVVEAAVRGFQQSRGLEVTGEVDDETWSKLWL